jgi:HSP20 family protein
MSEKDIDLSISGDMLILKGEKRQEREEKDKNRYLSERSYGAFQRSFALPEGVDRDKIAAQFSKDVLTITLPKTPHAQQQQKRIEVKAS